MGMLYLGQESPLSCFGAVVVFRVEHRSVRVVGRPSFTAAAGGWLRPDE